jgi:hypothetical protein
MVKVKKSDLEKFYCFLLTSEPECTWYLPGTWPGSLRKEEMEKFLTKNDGSKKKTRV